MKKRIAILLVAVMALTAFACQNNGDAKDTETNALIGTWTLVQVDGNTEEAQMAKMFLTMGTSEYTFFEDGKVVVTVTFNGEEQAQNYKYSVDGDKMTVNGDTAGYKIEGDLLTMYMNEGNFVYKRK